MLNRLFLFVLTITLTFSARSQDSAAKPLSIPSPEEFVNAIFRNVVDPSFSRYFLVAGTDSCQFTKYDYDEWSKYALKEPVPFTTLNELSEKVYLSRYPYFWKQHLLEEAACITRRQADSLIALPHPKIPNPNTVFSFSLPQFTDDGQYAVIDLNIICGRSCGTGLTCLFHRTAKGWKLIGQHSNWSS
jgi:hypothetical protein